MKKRYILWMLFLTFVFCPITGQAEEKSADPLERLQQVYRGKRRKAIGIFPERRSGKNPVRGDGIFTV